MVRADVFLWAFLRFCRFSMREIFRQKAFELIQVYSTKNIAQALFFFTLCSWQESNLHFSLRRGVSYPLNDKSVLGAF